MTLGEAKFGMGLSGLWPQFVGSHVGKSGIPDISQPSGVSGLDLDCRKCRVSLGGESFWKLESRS